MVLVVAAVVVAATIVSIAVVVTAVAVRVAVILLAVVYCSRNTCTAVEVAFALISVLRQYDSKRTICPQ